MAGSNSFVDGISDVTECPICMEVVSDPKLLPCIHTFCLKCLNQLWADKLPGDKVPCPMCRAEFIIPSGGFADLPKNFFIEKLIETKKASSKFEIPKCDVCVCRRVDREAANFCVECQQNLCKECTDVHKLLNNTKCHLVVSVKDCSQTDNSFRYSGVYCEHHKEEKIKLYCEECHEVLCSTCFIMKHNGHKYSDIVEVANNLKEQIGKYIEEADELITGLNTKSEHVDNQLNKFTANASQIEKEIVQRGEEIKQMVDEQVLDLLKTLNSKKSAKLKEMNILKEELLVQKMNCKSFKMFSEEVVKKANEVDVLRLASDLEKKAKELKQIQTGQILTQALLTFVPSDQFPGKKEDECNNVIGKLVVVEPKVCARRTLRQDVRRETDETSPPSIKSTASPYEKELKVLHSIAFPNSDEGTRSFVYRNFVGGITMVDEKLLIAVRHNSKAEVMIYNSATFALQSCIPVRRCYDVWDMTASGDVVFVSDSGGTICRIQLSDESITSWSLGRSCTSLSTTKSGNILVCSRGRNKIYEYSPGGVLQREISLYFTYGRDHIYDSERAVQLENDRFLVCQVWESNLHRVCLVDNEERLIRKSFGGYAGSGCSRLCRPHRLVVDRFGYILVADKSNNRVVLLDKELEYVKDLIPASANLKEIFTLYLDECKSRLYVGAGCELMVFELDGNV